LSGVWEILLILGCVSIPATIAYVSWRRRRAFLATLPSLATASLKRLAEGVLDAEGSTSSSSSVRAIESKLDLVQVEGTRRGEPVRLQTDFGPVVNQQYLANALTSAIVAEMKVTVGLRGATPRFSIKAQENASVHYNYGEFPPTIDDLEKAWVFEMDEKLALAVIDPEEIGLQLMRLRQQLPGVKSIDAHQGGLTITWTTPMAGISPPYNIQADEAGVAVATDLAIALSRRILDALEQRVRVGVGGTGGYREAQRIAPASEQEEDDEEEANLKRSSASQD
jgi:hypothetical protein